MTAQDGQDPADRRDPEAGMVTVEMAISLGALVVVFAMLVAGLGVMRQQADLCQAVREAARAAAIGEDPHAAAVRSYPRIGALAVERSGDWVRATGTAPAFGAAGTAWPQLSCNLTTAAEKGAPGGG